VYLLPGEKHACSANTKGHIVRRRPARTPGRSSHRRALQYWQLAQPGESRRRFFACRINQIDSETMALIAPVIGDIGEQIIVQSDEFGELKGPLVQVENRGFKLDIDATSEEREKLAAKIDWYEKHSNEEIPNRRRHKRILPHEPLSTLILADGSTPTCFVIDMSRTGVAVSAEIVPEIGMPLAVGRILGRVVRHLPNGFAVQFLRKHEFGALEQLLIKPPVNLHRQLKSKIVVR
jgi:hypothetical protein